VLRQVEQVLQHGGQGIERFLGVLRQRDEALPEVVDRLVDEDVQAVLLGLEVVIQRGGTDSDISGDVRPLGVLVAVAPEALGGRSEDRAAFGPVDRSCATSGARSLRRFGGRLS